MISDYKSFEWVNMLPEYYFKDCAVFHSDDIPSPCMVEVAVGDQKLWLNAQNDKRILQGQVALNFNQRTFLNLTEKTVQIRQKDFEDKSHMISAATWTVYPQDKKISHELLILIASAAQKALGAPAVLNLGHTVAVTVNDEIYSIMIDGLMNQEENLIYQGYCIENLDVYIKHGTIVKHLILG